MKRIPLYTDVESPVEECDQRELVENCDLCNFSKNADKTCAGDLGEPEGLLIVMDYPTKEEIRAKGNTLSKYRKFLYNFINKNSDLNPHKNIAFTYGIRCFPTGNVLKKHVDSCRPYLAKTIADCKPKKLFIFSTIGSELVLGRKFSNVRKAYTFLKNGTPVFIFKHPKFALVNRFEREALEEDIRWALSVNPMWAPSENTYRKVETEEDAGIACEELAKAPWYAFDTETCGRLFDDDFEVISLAACAQGSDEPWLWGREDLKNPLLIEPLKNLWQNQKPKMVGQNLKYDVLAVRCFFDLWIQNEVAGDTRLWTKLDDVEANGKLEVLAEAVGMGGHKKEAQTALKSALKAARADDRIKDRPSFIHNPKAYAYGYIEPEVLDRYCARDTVTTVRLGEMLEGKIASVPSNQFIWNTIVKDATKAYARIEGWGVAVSRDNLDLFTAHVHKSFEEAGARLKAWSNINFNSAAQVSDLLFAKLGLPVLSRTESGAPSTDMKSLKLLQGKHKIVDELINYRRYEKLKTSYADTIPMHIRDDGRLHPDILLDGTRTGRTSCKNPNLQQVTRAQTLEGKLLKNVYVASPGNVLLQLDYKTLEIMVAAFLSGDRKMIEVLKAGHDFHQKTAEDISQIVWGIQPKSITSAHRSIAKTTVFSKLYGSGNWSISKKLGVPVEAIDDAVNAIFSQYSTLKKWIQDQIRYTYKTGVTHTYWNGKVARTRQLPNIASPNDKLRNTAENGSYNSSVQGTANEYCIASAVQCVQMIEEKKLPAKLVLTVHDSLIFDVKESFAEELARLARDKMVSHYCGDVPLKVDIEKGYSWGELEKMELP